MSRLIFQFFHSFYSFFKFFSAIFFHSPVYFSFSAAYCNRIISKYCKQKGNQSMTLTQKEYGLLKDAKGQEELCIAKYQKYAAMAKSPDLNALFSSMAQVEQNHLQTITSMLNGTVPQTAQKLENANNEYCKPFNYATDDERKSDALLCQDMLTTEKHVSALYDTSIFEFSDPQARQTLNHIQSEEQQHGEQIYAYMKCNLMYS